MVFVKGGIGVSVQMMVREDGDRVYKGPYTISSDPTGVVAFPGRLDSFYGNLFIM